LQSAHSTDRTSPIKRDLLRTASKCERAIVLHAETQDIRYCLIFLEAVIEVLVSCSEYLKFTVSVKDNPWKAFAGQIVGDC
jgi:hypothetical protein